MCLLHCAGISLHAVWNSSLVNTSISVRELLRILNITVPAGVDFNASGIDVAAAADELQRILESLVRNHY